MRGVVTSATFHARCSSCGWGCSSSNAMAVGAQHAARWGHVVAVVQTVTFERRRGRAPAQAELGLAPRRRRGAA